LRGVALVPGLDVATDRNTKFNADGPRSKVRAFDVVPGIGGRSAQPVQTVTGLQVQLRPELGLGIRQAGAFHDHTPSLNQIIGILVERCGPAFRKAARLVADLWLVYGTDYRVARYDRGGVKRGQLADRLKKSLVRIGQFGPA